MMTDTLSDFKERCRCCLEDAKGDVYIKITKFIEDRFLEFTSTNLVDSDKLPSKICMTCNSLLARYLAIKRSFLDNQMKLRNLLKKAESNCDDSNYVNCELLQTEPFTFIESIEPFEESEKVEKSSQSEKSKHCRSKVKIKTKVDNTQKCDKLKSVKGFFHCDDCSYRCCKKYSLLIHNHKNHNGPVPQKQFVCELCSKGFHVKETLLRHIAFHNNDRPFACDYCGHRSHVKQDLGNHLKTHIPRELYKCNYEGCKASYKFEQTLRTHIKCVHLNATKYPCKLCSKSFFKHTVLERHVKHVHQKWRPVQCDIENCSSSFICNSHLLRHKKNVHKIKLN